MTDYVQGTSIPLTAQFYEFAGGPGAALTGVTVTITRIGAGSPTVGPTSTGVGNPATGLYTYTWATTTSTTVGSYTVVWNGVDVSSDPVQASQVVGITAASQAVTGLWASTLDVIAITGAEVTDVQLAQASSVITVYANRNTASAANLTTRDLYWLKQACAWQARWQAQQPGYDQKSSVDSVNQDNTQVAYGKEWQISLAPLAARALKNLSWKGARSIPVHSTLLPRGVDFTNEESDWYSQWGSFGAVG